MTVLCDDNIVFNAYATYIPVSFEYVGIYILSQFWRSEIGIDDKTAKVDLLDMY